MDGLRRYALLLTICAGLPALASGCHLFGRRNPPPPVFPAILQPGASLSQVIDAVNNNSRRIQSFSTQEAQLSGPGIPLKLQNSTIAFQRPMRLRIQAGTGMMGPELDVGSNDELFWVWIRRSEKPGVFFCRHDRYASCPDARQIPVEPGWLIEAFGIVEFSPNERPQGPVARSDGRLEIMTSRQTPCGLAAKKTVIDASTALVHEQHLYDQQGRIVASVVVREHRLDPLSGLVMPKIVDLQCPQAQFSMSVNLGNVEINGPAPSSAMWTKPTIPGWPDVDLAGPMGPQRRPQATPWNQAIPQPLPPSADRRQGFNRLR